MEEERELIMIAEAMRRTGNSRRTINNWIRDGKVEVLYTAGGGPRIYADTLWRDHGKGFQKGKG